MKISAIPNVPVAASIVNATPPANSKPVAQSAPPAPVATDSDGDNDGSSVNVKA